jgi:thiamine biosynthesis protein ThiS
MPNLRINGEARSFSEDLTVAELLRRLEVRAPAIAVEVNRAVVPRVEHERRRLEDGDEIEIVTFVGGG